MKKLNGRTLIVIMVVLASIIIFTTLSIIQRKSQKQEHKLNQSKTEESTSEVTEEPQEPPATQNIYGWIDSNGSKSNQPISDVSNKQNNEVTNLKTVSDIICESKYDVKVFILTETSYNKVYSLLRSDNTIWSIVYNKTNDSYFYTNDELTNINEYREYINSTWDNDLYVNGYCEYIYAVLQDDGETLDILERSNSMKTLDEVINL